MAVSAKSAREQVRCAACGRILFERARGMVFKERHARGGGNEELVVLGTPVVARCGGCGRAWINPDMVAFDGVGAVVEQMIRSVTEAASRPRQQRRPLHVA
jgi:ribosomal protein S27E